MKSPRGSTGCCSTMIHFHVLVGHLIWLAVEVSNTQPPSRRDKKHRKIITVGEIQTPFTPEILQDSVAKDSCKVMMTRLPHG